MATQFTKAELRRAIRSFKGKTVREWSNSVVNEALNLRQDAVNSGDEVAARLWLAIDTVGYAMRHLEFSSRFNARLFEEKMSEGFSYIESIVRVTYLKRGSVDFAGIAYREFAGLHAERLREAA